MSRPPVPRAHPRYAIRLSAELRTAERRFAAVTRNLSRGGCCVEAAYLVPEGTAIELALFVVVDDVEDASLPPLEGRAEIQWTAQNDEAALDGRHIMGLRFMDLSAGQLDWLARFLSD